MKNNHTVRPPDYKSGRLNLWFLGRLFWIFLLFDLLLALFLFGNTLWRAETNAHDWLNSRPDWTGESWSPLDKGDLVLSTSPRPQAGLTLPGVMQRWMPMKNDGTIRRMDSFSSARIFPMRLQSVVYILWLPDSATEITCFIGPELAMFGWIFVILSVFQLIFLLSSISKGARAIRRTLHPLYQMIEQAHSLSVRTAKFVHVDGMAGELYDIDGRQLHRRISMQDAPEELKPLASAINDMLERIEAAYEAQSRFVSDASHELRTPIAVIQGYVNLLDRWGKTDEATLQESIEALKSEARGMGEMVEQLLFLARGDSDAIPLTPEPVNLDELCEEVARDMRVATPGCEITVKGEAIKAHADRTLCRQALRILLDNAVKYGEGQPVTLMSGTDTPGWVFVSVSDNGPGIAPGDMPRLFDRFYRSDASRARQTGGAGLGLSIAHWIAIRHGGKITAFSRLGIGTRMTLTLPGGDSNAITNVSPATAE